MRYKRTDEYYTYLKKYFKHGVDISYKNYLLKQIKKSEEVIKQEIWYIRFCKDQITVMEEMELEKKTYANK
jgi:hypothetical protein